MTARDQNKSLIEQLHAIWNTGDLNAIPDVYASDVVVHWGKSGRVAESHGHAGVRDAIAGTRLAFPDWHERIVDMVIEGDRVVTRYISTGTHEGPYMGIAATGNAIEIDEMSLYQIANGTVAEQWCLVDDLTFLHQLGQR